MFLSENEFNSYKNTKFNLVPVCLELRADLDTPLSIYLKLVGKNRANSFLLESVIGGERFGRFSYIGLPSCTYLETDFNDITSLYENNKLILSLTNNPLDDIKSIQNKYNALILKGMPRFCGGWVGYFGYETIHYIEPILVKQKTKRDNINLSTIKLLLCTELAVVDNLKGSLLLIKYINPNIDNAYAIANVKLQQLRQNLETSSALDAINFCANKKSEPRYFTQKTDYMNNVEIAKKHIKAGDIMQVVLSQRMAMDFTTDSILLYRNLRQLNPSPYMYYYCFGDTQIVGSSPELLVRRETHNNDNHNDAVMLRPIAGTRPRGKDEAEDLQLAQDLMQDEKELAEHTMLIDLARNDIGRVAIAGSIKVTQNMQIEKYSHVQHIVSSVQGEINSVTNNIDIIKAVFPAGTLSGAAKVRAMQIIKHLELIPRHIYGGGVGYISFNNDMDLAIAIRTAVIQNNIAYIQSGAGIVDDSVPENEWIETQNKAKAIIKAIQAL